MTQKSKKTAPNLPPGWKTKPTSQQRHLRLYQCQTLSEWPQPKWTKVATSPTTSAASHPGFLKFLTRFHKKINSQKSSKDFNVQNPERSSAMEPPCTATNSQRPADSSFKSMQIWENFYKTDATTRSIGPWSTIPKNCKPKIGHTRLHASPKSLDKSLPSPSKLCKFAHYFWKLTTPLDPSTFDLQDPKISGPEDKPRASGIIGASFMRHLTQPHAWRAKCWHVPSVHDVMDDIILQYLGLTRTDLETLPGPNRLQKKKKKKEKKKKKKLWLSRTWTLTKKSKFSKMACSTKFFEYILILRSVSSFEAWKLCKLSNF